MKSLTLISVLLTIAAAAPVAQPKVKVETKRANFEIDTILDVNRDPEKSSYAYTGKRANFEIDTILDVNRNPEKSSYATLTGKRTNFEIDTILDVNRDPRKSSYATEK